jgi:hypothetical protein
MKRKIFLHIGPPKTGTTSIQEFFKRNHQRFREIDIGGMLGNGEFRANRLAVNLIKLDALKRDFNLNKIHLLKSEKSNEVWPQFEQLSNLFISNEDFFYLGIKGSKEIIAFANKNNADLTILVVPRDPLEWMWSNWCQITKSIWKDWCQYTEECSSKRIGFIGDSLRLWCKEGVHSLEILEYSKDNFLRNFFYRFAPKITELEDLDFKLSVNLSNSISEDLYRSILIRSINENIDTMEIFRFHRPSKPFISRMLIDISDNSHPTFEISQIYDSHYLKDNNILGTESYPALIKYLSAWISDADEAFISIRSFINESSQNALQSIISKATNDLEKLSTGTYQKIDFPNKNYSKMLPINSQFIGLARSLACSIILADRAKNNN